jgi:predicted nucleic-acid-binding protein
MIRSQPSNVTQVVQIETGWVLESVYDFTRVELVEALEAVLSNQSFVLQQSDIFRAALAEFRIGPADFAGYVILMEARAENIKLATFDRKLSKLKGTRLVSVSVG